MSNATDGEAELAELTMDTDPEEILNMVGVLEELFVAVLSPILAEMDDEVLLELMRELDKEADSDEVSEIVNELEDAVEENSGDHDE